MINIIQQNKDDLDDLREEITSLNKQIVRLNDRIENLRRELSDRPTWYDMKFLTVHVVCLCSVALAVIYSVLR